MKCHGDTAKVEKKGSDPRQDGELLVKPLPFQQLGEVGGGSGRKNGIISHIHRAGCGDSPC